MRNQEMGEDAAFPTFAPMVSTGSVGWKGLFPVAVAVGACLLQTASRRDRAVTSNSGLSEWGLRDFRPHWLSGKGSINATLVLLTFQSENFDPTDDAGFRSRHNERTEPADSRQGSGDVHLSSVRLSDAREIRAPGGRTEVCRLVYRMSGNAPARVTFVSYLTCA
jgi:hypothetical protein